MTNIKPKVALSQDFLARLAKLPAAVHGKVLKWALRFQADPAAAGINYEKIQGAHGQGGSNLRSVRIDQDWRGIVFKPDSGDVYVLLYVDHHDDAYRWAENRKLAIHPVTGAMQLVVLQEVVEQRAVEQKVVEQEVVEQGVAKIRATGGAPDVAMGNMAAILGTSVGHALFASFAVDDLLSLGVPNEAMAQVMRIVSEAELDHMQAMLPVEAYEGLFLLAAGDTVEQILAARDTVPHNIIDTQDFIGSLATPESQARFVVVESDAALTAIMNAPLAQWRIFLHPTQRKLAIGMRSGPVRILGGAGTGKTVLAMHRAKWLAENCADSGKKVLFTTFTRNLAFDIEENLQSLCPPATMKKIEVRNLDAWVQGFLRSRQYEHTIIYDRRKEALAAWQRALALKDANLDLDDAFYEQELEQVILAQGVSNRDEYRLARRTGRGVVLNRSKRDAIWPVFEEYRCQLSSSKLKEVDDAYRDAARLLLEERNANKPHQPYCAVVVDETQDFGPQALRLLRAMIAPGPNDLCFVGDGHQRIYSRNRAAMSRCEIDIRGRSKKLYLNYRTTEQIRLKAVSLLEGCEIDDLDDGHDETRKYKSLSQGAVPMQMSVDGVAAALQLAQELVANWVKAAHEADPGQPLGTCVIAPERAVRDAAAKLFAQHGWRTEVIDASKKDACGPEVIRFATLHRAKGLEFDQVLVLAPQAFLAAAAQTSDQRKLLYVGLTRAKRGAGLVVY